MVLARRLIIEEAGTGSGNAYLEDRRAYSCGVHGIMMAPWGLRHIFLLSR